MTEPIEGHLEPQKNLESEMRLLPLHLVFIGMALLFLILGSLLQHYDFKIGILATEFGMLVIPATLYMKFRKNSIREQFKFNLPKLSDVWKMVLASLLFVPTVAFLNGMLNVWLMYGLQIEAPQIPLETGLFAPIITFLIAAATPGFCEEYVFRGLLLTEYQKKMGYFQAALISALLFGMFHYNVMNFFGPFALGLLFAWVMQVTNSIWLAMLGHMINNTMAVVLLYVNAGADPEQATQAIEQLGNLWPLAAAGALVFILLVALPTGYASVFLLKSIRKQHLKSGDQLQINDRYFIVESSEKYTLQLRERYLDGPQSAVIDTTYAKLYQNKSVRLINRHWESRNCDYKLRLKEWWPVLICAMMYVGVNILNLIALTADAAK